MPSLPLPLAAAHATAGTAIPLWLAIPFALLLALIAIAPLTPPRVKHVWEHYYPWIAGGLGALVAGFYLAAIDGGATTIGHTLHEYFSFIALIGSLFVVAGGIHITVKGEGTPLGNVVFLLLGGVIANLVGTTGASMVLVRPWIRFNRIRISAYHIVFFIFVVSNVGGALTPIGDPPLFLGYLRGVPFFWLAEHVLLQWLVTLGAVLAVFYVIDRRMFRRMPARVQREVAAADQWTFDGAVNVLLLLVVIGAVFLPPVPLLREGVMIAAALASLKLTPERVHRANAFGFGPIKEVAFLFLGIFLTMMPALGYLAQHGPSLGLEAPLAYYFATGGLSAVLDNAPTYLNFLTLAEATTAAAQPDVFAAALAGGDERAGVVALLGARPELVVAVSLGAVFFGAMTYIGNGPNFMVKSIAEESRVKVPTFFGYLARYALPILLPVLAIVGWLFLR